MKKYLEKFLASVLLGLTILSGLSFWLNTHFGFNMFYAPHWDELAKLQAVHAPINKWFYISVGIAIFLFIFGLYIIFRPRFRNLFKTVGTKKENHEQNHQTTATVIPQPVAPTVSKTNISVKQPPKLNLPKNIVEIVAQQYEKQSSQPTSQQPTVYDSQLSELFAKANYLVKPNLTITGFTTNLFAIGTDELVWFGAVNCDINKFKTAANKLKSIFETTLEDVPITISAFILDTRQLYETDDETLVFHSMEELSNFVNENPNPQPSDLEKENFDAYSDYIDTIIQYAKNT